MATFPTAGDDDITGTPGPDTINGLEGNDQIHGGEGNDVLDGGPGQDSIYGEGGNDTLSASGGTGDWLFGGLGNDTLTASFGSFNMFGDEGDDQLTLTNGGSNSWLNGGNGDDVIFASGSGEQILADGSGGNDDITIQGYTRGNVNTGQGTDIVRLPAGYFTLNVTGGFKTIEITSIGPGFITVIGLNAGEEGDVLDLSIYGADPFGDGSLVWGSNGPDAVIDHVASGMRYVLQNVLKANLSAYNLGVPNPAFAPQGMTLDDDFAEHPHIEWAGELVGADGNDLLRGHAGSDILLGAGGNDRLEGGTGADVLKGGTGNDILVGGGGVDDLSGGTGADVFLYVNSNDSTASSPDTIGAFQTGLDKIDLRAVSPTEVSWASQIDSNSAPYNLVTVQTASGAMSIRVYGDLALSDFILSTPSIVGGDGDDLLIGTSDGEEILGNGGNDILQGLGEDDWLEGGAGDDQLDGGVGADTMAGGIGNDVFTIDNPGDTVTEFAGQGTDEIRLTNLTAFSLAGAPEVENLTAMTNGASLVLTGNALANQIRAGLEGDVIDGGAGADIMIGRSGDDIYYADNADDQVVELAGEGLDEVRTGLAAFSLAPFANVEKLTGTNAAGQALLGNEGSNVITGAGGDDVIDGASGADTMIGGFGNDIYYVDNIGDTFTEIPGQGADEVRTTLQTFAHGITDVEVVRGMLDTGQHLIGGDTIIAGAGNDTLEGAETMIGGLGDDSYIIHVPSATVVEAAGQGIDTIFYSSYVSEFNILADNVENVTGLGNVDQKLTGNALDNIIDGGLGRDDMVGGLGNDIFIVDDAGDKVTEASGQGMDEVRTSVSFTLTSEVERLTGIGSAGLTLTGNALDNVITGGSGADRLVAGLGTDQLIGGLGDDTYVVDSGDSVVENAGGGYDTVESAFSYILGTNLEKLVLTGSSAVSATGNGLANILTGNASANTIDGMGGADGMAGGFGDDIYVIDDAGDTVTELASQGSDEIRATLAAYSLAATANVENLTGLSDAGQSLTGNELANLIKGGWGNDLIDGGLGADDMRGSLGNDLYLVDNAGDTVTEGEEQGLDEVRTNLASFSIAGFANVENLTGGAADQTLTGNGFNNVIDGGAGADTMAGGGGHDVYIVDNLGDVVIELDGAGTDEVRTGLGSKAGPAFAVYVIPDVIENLTGTSAGAQGVRDNALNNIISMGVGHDLVVADAGGVDTINGGGGNDFIYYGDKLTAADITNGGSGSDTIGLIGNYAGLVFTATNLVGVERMALYTSLYLPGTGPNNYNVTMSDANVAAGTEFFVTAASLQSNESLTFNGSAETDGKFTVHGGAGNDTISGGTGSDFFLGNAGNDALNGGGGNDFLNGGLGADLLTGGGGFDAFRYQSAAQSTAASMDHILDFTDLDRIDLSAIDADGNAGNGNQAFTFIGSGAFGNVAGQLRAYQSGADWFVEGDTNGDGVADLVIQVTITDPTLLTLGASDFNL